MNGTDNFFAILDKAGSSPEGSPSTTDGLLFQALERLHYSDPARTFVQKAAESNSAVGRRLARLTAWGQAEGDIPVDPPDSGINQPPAPGLRAGEVVVDVGSQLSADQGAFDGTLNPVLMSRPNWGYYAKHNLGAKSGHIFDRPFTIGDPNTGETFDDGTLAALQNFADPIVRDAQGNQATDLSQFG